MKHIPVIMEKRDALCYCLAVMLVIGFLVTTSGEPEHKPLAMSKEEREALRDEARDMFYHAYRAYMDNAYPADELMPLTCQGRYRGSHPSRGDIDDVLGNFSLTLIDTLDTLVVLGDLSEFEHAVRLVARDVTFDTDVDVSVFETNIRVLGGLLSGHVMAEYVQQKANVMKWYRGELLVLAKELGYRLLPAFNTTTGIPHARVNLRHGLKSQRLESARETCTACAGTMVLEMAALSRLTGESIFEERAHRAMDSLWKMRHRSSDLMGTVLNVHSGDWVRRDSGVGAGIDSYYEYCLKAYVLLGHNKYLTRFNKHYSAVMKYISQGPLLLDVHMHRPNTNSRNFMDALLAFWPGLQVLTGDLKPAVETHEMLYQVLQRHNFIPEAFTTDFQVHWGQYPLRPEFLESTYFLYKATGDPYYLRVGKRVLKRLQTYARVPCGYAAVSDVRTGNHDDRMDSFVLAETFKYLFLLFAEPSELLVDMDKFLFTTEAHLLPLTLARKSTNSSHFMMGDDMDETEESRGAPQCPSSLRLFPEAVRRPLRNMVHASCPQKQPRRLTASNFQPANPDHLQLISDMGISIMHLEDGRIQLLHTFSKAKTMRDAEEGLLLMQEMLEVSKTQTPETYPLAVSFNVNDEPTVLLAGPAHFGKQLKGSEQVTGKVAIADPLKACSTLNKEDLEGKIAIVQRGDCLFVDKARFIMEAGAIGGIVMDNVPGSAMSSNNPLFAMSGVGQDEINIPLVFLFSHDSLVLLNTLIAHPGTQVTLSDKASLNLNEREVPKAPIDESLIVPDVDKALEKAKEKLHHPTEAEETSPNVGIGEATPVEQSDIVTPDAERQDHLIDMVSKLDKTLIDPLNLIVKVLGYESHTDIPENAELNLHPVGDNIEKLSQRIKTALADMRSVTHQKLADGDDDIVKLTVQNIEKLNIAMEMLNALKAAVKKDLGSVQEAMQEKITEPKLDSETNSDKSKDEL